MSTLKIHFQSVESQNILRTSVVVLPVLDSHVGVPFLTAPVASMHVYQWLAFAETPASPMRAHVGAAFASVGPFREPDAGARLALRAQAGARSAFALARVAPPTAPVDPGWWAAVESDALRTHRELAAALLAYDADDAPYVGS